MLLPTLIKAVFAVKACMILSDIKYNVTKKLLPTENA